MLLTAPAFIVPWKHNYRSIVIELQLLNIKLKPIRIDLILFWKKEIKGIMWGSILPECTVLISILFCFVSLGFWNLAAGQVSRHGAFICKPIKKKSHQMGGERLGNKELWSCALTMIHYQLTQRSYSGNTHIELYITRMHWFIVVITSTSLKDSALLQSEGYILFTAIN